MKIEKLTEEQEAQLSVYRDKWLEIGLRTTDGIDKPKAEAAICEAYQCAGLEPPKKFMYVGSPMAGCRAAYFLSIDAEDDGSHDEDTVKKGSLEQLGQCVYGNHDAAWLGFYEYFWKIVNLDCCEKLSGLINMAQHVGWCWLFDEVAVVSPLPQKLIRDDDHNLHSETGPALEYPDGFSIYSWHGVRVPAEWIEKTEELDPREALQWENMEQRRALCEIIGWEKVLKTLDCKTIHEDKYGKLIETDQIPDSDVTRFVLVRDSSTDREYALCVPNDVETAHAAVASTFGLTASEYNPTMET